MLHLHQPLTLYVSRHSWASIARSLNVPLAVISEGMGHDSDKENWNPMLEKDSPVLPSSDELMVNSYKGIRL